MKKLLFLFCVIIGLMPGLISGQADDMVIIPLQFRDAQEAQPMVKNLLSDQGRLTVDTRTNSLVVIDRPEILKKVKAFIAKYDVRLEPLQVRVKFKQSASAEQRSISAQGNASGKHWRISSGGSSSQNGVAVTVQDQRQKQSGESEFFLNTSAGEWAYILVGQDILFNEQWIDLAQRYSRVYETWTVKTIESGFDVNPKLVGNHALIEIIPRISQAPSGKNPEVIRFTKASVELRIPLGEWVEIGGMDQASKEVFHAIFSYGSESLTEAVSIAIMVQRQPE